MNNNLFFTITIQDQATHFSSLTYAFTIKDSEQQIGTNGKALWYHYFERPDLDLRWVSWNRKNNGIKAYLLIDIKGTLYSGFINQSKTKEDTYYCELKPLPSRLEDIFIYQ